MTFEEESFAPFEALEGDFGLNLRAGSRVRLDTRLRQREATSEGPARRTRGSIGFEGDRAEIHLRAGVEDVDTLRAKLESVDLRIYQLQHLNTR